MGMGGGSAAKQAAEQEKLRQAQVGTATSRINSIYDSPERAAQQQSFFESLRSLLTSDVNRQQETAARQLKFANARNGQTGGSVARDNNVELGKDYSRGLLDATRRAQGALADVQGSDEAARSNLLGLAQAGLDTGSAATQAASSMRVGLDKARANAMGGVPDVFKATSDIWKRSQEAAERRRGTADVRQQLYANDWS
jgi:hypothetical protein